MEIFNAVTAVIAAAGVICSIIFGWLAFGRNKVKDNSDMSAKLAKIETDILYIRQTLDEHKFWERDIESRVRNLESKGYK